MISFDVTEDDQRAWMEFAIEEQGRVAALRLSFSLLVVLVSGIAGFSLADFAGLGVGAALGAVVAVTLLPWLLRHSVRRQIDQAIASAPDGSVGPVTLELAADSLTWRTTAAESTWRRRAIRRVAIRGDHAFIMFGPNNGLIVPLADDSSGERRRWIEVLNAGRQLGSGD